MSRIAVVGAGISGLACAWMLAKRHDVVLYESARHAGGHAHTFDATVDGTTAPVDTGFLVYNDRNYPNLAKLLAALGVESANAEMSFSVRIGEGALEWSGRSLAGVFAQPSNLVSPRFLRMLADLLRFNREAARLVEGGDAMTGTLGEFLDARGFGREVRELYLFPMAACIWFTPATRINRFPLAAFLRFCANHDLFSVSKRSPWRTVKGGSREYVNRLVASLPDVRLASRVAQVRRLEDRVDIVTERGTERFDQVVLATHTDQALALLELDQRFKDSGNVAVGEFLQPGLHLFPVRPGQLVARQHHGARLEPAGARLKPANGGMVPDDLSVAVQLQIGIG